MFKNYFKTAFRGFIRQKSSFVINLLGLTIGLTCSFLVALWIMDEYQVDSYHSDSDRIYQIMGHQIYSDDVATRPNTPGILSRNIVQDFQEIEYAATYTWDFGHVFTKDDKVSRQSGFFVEHDIFNILDIHVISGTKERLLTAPNSVVLSEEMATKFFGEANPIGEGITIDNSWEVTITGVVENMPANSTFQFDYLLHYDDWLESMDWANDWGNNGPFTLSKIGEDVDVDELNEKIKFYTQSKTDISFTELMLYPFSDLYLKGTFSNKVSVGGRIEYVRLFIIVAIFILLIACINFMNLSTARASKRSKEVGIRKSIGASQRSLIGRFIGESMIISFFALILSIALVEFSLPWFNALTLKDISVDYANPKLLAILIGVTLFTGLLSGSYPAFYLSSLHAIETLKGNVRSSLKEVFTRKGLVVFQISLSMILIVATIAIYNQIQFTQNKNLGYEKDNLLYFNVEDEVSEQWETVKVEMEKIPEVVSIATASHTLLGEFGSTSGISWPGKSPDTDIEFENFGVDFGFFETLNMEFTQGRSFSMDFVSDSSGIVLNETAIKAMGLENPIGETVNLWGRNLTIIGVVKDFHFESFRNSVSPAFFRITREDWRAFVRLETDDISNTLRKIETVYKQFNNDYPFEYGFMDQEYENLYRSELKVGILSRYFAVIAIFLSCLGLFGLSAFTAEQRAKEIGVRKVLGASVQNLIVLLTSDYTRLVLISIVISLPISMYLINLWLSNFVYSAGIDWWIYLVAGVCTLSITWITVGWQSFKTALMNPVKSLKSE